MANNEDDFLVDIKDKDVRQFMRRQIDDLIRDDYQPQKKQKDKDKDKNSQVLNINKQIDPNNIYHQNEDQYEDYQAELNPYKRNSNYQIIQPVRFKLIAHTDGPKRKPILRMTDLYVPQSEKVQKLLDRVIEERIYGRHQATAELQTKVDQNEQFQKILKNWQNKRDQDQFQNKKNQITQQQLQDIVVNLGDKKQNYFLFFKGQTIKKRQEQYIKKHIKNLPVSNPNFLQNLRKSVARLQIKNRQIQEFQSDSEDQINPNTNKLNQNKTVQNTEPSRFGSLKVPIQKLQINQPFINTQQKQLNNFSSNNNPTVLEKIQLDIKKRISGSQQDPLIKYYSYSNSAIIQDKHLGPIQNFHKIQYNLSNPYFFLPKLHTVLQRHSDDLNKLKQSGEQRRRDAAKNFGNVSQLDKSKISGSLYTGNKQQFSKPSLIQGGNGQLYPILDDDQQQTIQRRIQTQIKNIYKDPLHHSEVATKFDLIKFTLDEDVYHNFHRYLFPFQRQLKDQKVKVKIILHKSRKIKPKDLIINTQMKNSNIKYAKKEQLSVIEGQFIMIQYIEQHPLIISNVGMCQKMFIQVNYQELLEKIKEDQFKDVPLDAFQEARDSRNNSINQISLNQNQFEKKCERWRENIKSNFGQNGKLFLWDPSKNQGKLIGSPQGLGVALMESKLSTYPIVKKKNNPRDFLLVRDGNKWFLRRIDNLYVSGQIEPNKKIFNPDSRDYLNFKSNYQKAYMRRQISLYGSVNFENVKQCFVGQTQSSLKKALKSIRATSNDNKNYTIVDGFQANVEYQLQPEDVCLYERMQKSICLLKQVGITQIRNNQKMKNVLKQFNKKNIQSIQKFTISRMIKDQLLLSSWYLTDSFAKFRLKTSKIQIVGAADPTNGKGGFSFINKPQKQRTAKQDIQDKLNKQRVSGTDSDLRKLKTSETKQKLLELGHAEQDLQGKGRWGLVEMIRKQQNTQYARKQRQTKLKKSQNEKKQISRIFNKMLSYLNEQTAAPVFKYNFKKSITLSDLTEKQKANWMKTRQKLLKNLNQAEGSDVDDEFQDENN